MITYRELRNRWAEKVLKAGIENADFDMDITITEFEEDDDTLDAKATVAILPGKEIDVHLTFDDDGCNGYLKIPFVGKRLM